MQIYIIRHGLSEGNASGVIQGYSDSPLTDIGQAQANLLGRYFKHEGIIPEKIIASPLRRAYQTAEIIAGEIDPNLIIETHRGLMEVDVGDLSGLSIEDAIAKYPEWGEVDVNKWLEFSAAGGESYDEFFRRVDGAAKEIMIDWDLLSDRTIFLVAHAGAMRPLLKTLLDSDDDMMFFTFGNCCHVKVEYRPVRESIRRVMIDLIRIEKVAAIMCEENPGKDVEDSVGRRIG